MAEPAAIRRGKQEQLLFSGNSRQCGKLRSRTSTVRWLTGARYLEPGAVLYEMVVERAPLPEYTKRSAGCDCNNRTAAAQQPRVTGPASFSRLSPRRCKRSRQRYENAKEMLDALKGLRHELELWLT
jgi:hypothetical protein